MKKYVIENTLLSFLKTGWSNVKNVSCMYFMYVLDCFGGNVLQCSDKFNFDRFAL